MYITLLKSIFKIYHYSPLEEFSLYLYITAMNENMYIIAYGKGVEPHTFSYLIGTDSIGKGWESRIYKNVL